MDVQGAGKARPYLERANASFTTLIDEYGVLAEKYGFKAIPNGLLINEKGFLDYMSFKGFDIRHTETNNTLRNWITNSKPKDESFASPLDSNRPSIVFNLFQQGAVLYKQGRIKDGIDLWKQAVNLEPDNYLIRKQIWAIENPDKFYQGDVDYIWQREQLEKGL